MTHRLTTNYAKNYCNRTRHRSRDHLIAHMPFPIGSPLASISNGFWDIQRRM